MQIKNKRQILTTIISVLVSVFLVATATYAVTTVGDDVDVGDDLTVTGDTTLDGTLGVTDLITAAGGVAGNLTGNVTGNTITLNGATGVNILTIPTNLADALSIVDSTGDLIVFKTTTGAREIAITPATTIAGALAVEGTVEANGGVSVSTGEALNIVDDGAGLCFAGVPLTAKVAELNVLDGIPGTLTATELGYVDGVTSAIQTQLDNKVPYTGATADVDLGLYGLTADSIYLRALGAVIGVDPGGANETDIAFDALGKVAIRSAPLGSPNPGAILDVNSITTTDKTFTFPDLSGTLGVVPYVHAIATVSVNNGGTGYTVNDVLTLTTGGTGGTVTVTGVTGGVIDTVDLTTAGTGYAVGTSAVTGGTGNNDAIINIDTLVAESNVVPYTGATANVDLGIFNLTLGQTLKGLKTGWDIEVGAADVDNSGGYITISAGAGNGEAGGGNVEIFAGGAGSGVNPQNGGSIILSVGAGTNGGTDGFIRFGNNAYLSYSLLGGDQTYQFPDASGTLALTSNASTNHATCWKDEFSIGYCSSTVGADGTCTCN